MTDTRARPAAAGDDVVARLRRWGASDYDTHAHLTLDGASIATVPWIRHATDLHEDMAQAAAAIEARDAEIARLRDTLEAQKQAALDMMEAKDKALLSLAGAILDREPHDAPLVPMRLRLAAIAALAPQPASDGGTP